MPIKQQVECAERGTDKGLHVEGRAPANTTPGLLMATGLSLGGGGVGTAGLCSNIHQFSVVGLSGTRGALPNPPSLLPWRNIFPMRG